MSGSVVRGLRGVGAPWRQLALDTAQPLLTRSLRSPRPGALGSGPSQGQGAGRAQIRPPGRLSDSPERLRGECRHLGHRAPWVMQGTTSVSTTAQRRPADSPGEPRGAGCGGEQEPAGGPQQAGAWHPGGPPPRVC